MLFDDAHEHKNAKLHIQDIHNFVEEMKDREEMREIAPDHILYAASFNQNPVPRPRIIYRLRHTPEALDFNRIVLSRLGLSWKAVATHVEGGAVCVSFITDTFTIRSTRNGIEIGALSYHFRHAVGEVVRACREMRDEYTLVVGAY